MPTLKKRAWHLAPPPADDGRGDKEGARDKEAWVCRATGEVFDDYETYFNRFNLYRLRLWTCTSTGKMNLTYEEALSSERKARRLMEEGLPDIWKKAVLSKANYSVDRIDAVVDQVHAALRDHAFLDEDVTIEISQWTSKPARIVQAPDTTDDNYDEPYVPKGYCRIAFLSSFGEPDGNEGEIIPIKKVKRDRIAFSKQNFKRFLKENMIRENWPGAPMVVKPEVAARLGISMEIPPAIQDLYRRRLEGPDYRPPRTLNAEPGFPTMYPIDDTQLWKLIKSDPTFLQKHGNLPWLLNAIEVDDAPTMGPRPEGRKVPGGSVLVPQGVIGDLLYVWNFLIVFCKPLNLYPYTFDEFLHALVLPWSRNDVLSETVCALLKKAQKMRDDLVKAAEKAKAEAAKAAAAAAAAAAKRGDDEDEDEDGEGAPGTPKVEPGSSPAKSGLGLAGAVSSPASAKPGVKNESGEVVVQLTDAQPAVPLTGQALVAQTVDQNINFIRAWTAFPWHQYTMVYNVKGAPAPNPLRLKGWQASLFSAMVDLVWMLPGNRAPEDWVPGYWNIVGKMLEVVDAEEEEEGVGDMYRFEEEPEVEQAPTTVVVQPQPKKEEDVDMSVFEDEGVEFEGADADAGSEVSDDYGGKKEKVKAGKKRPAPAPIEPEFIDPTKRRRLGAGMYDESRNVTMPGVKDVVTLTQQAQQPQQLSEIIKKSHKKKAPELSFLEKCERGWKRLKIREKLAMLRFLIEEVVSSEDGVRKYMDQADYELNQLRAYRGAIAEDKAYLEKARAELEEKFRAEDGDADAAETGTAGDPESGTIEEDDEVHAPASDAAPVPPQPKRDAADNSEDEEIDFEDSDEASNSGSLSTGGPKIPSARQVDALAAAKQRQADEKARRAARSALAKVQKEKQKAAKARYDERKKIEDQVKALQRRAAVVERQYHGWSAVVHGRPLGRDRWFNRYYWFDSWFGGGVADFVQTDNRAKKGEATEGGPLQRWASGKIWIELVGPEDITDPTWNKIAENPRMLDVAGKEWIYLETEAEIDALMLWLNPRGEREMALQAVLKECMDDIKAGIRKREEELTHSFISRELASNKRRGAHDGKKGNSYQNWWAGGFPK